MNIIASLITLVFSSLILSSPISMENVRKNYQNAVKDKESCKMMITELGKQNNNNVQLAYYGAFQAIWANHVFNPIEKLSTFNRGKKNIDNAAKLSSDNIEIIFIRYSIQKNCPRFLGYRSNLKEDRNFLIKNVSTIASMDLKKIVENIIKE